MSSDRDSLWELGNETRKSQEKGIALRERHGHGYGRRAASDRQQTMQVASWKPGSSPPVAASTQHTIARRWGLPFPIVVPARAHGNARRRRRRRPANVLRPRRNGRQEYRFKVLRLTRRATLQTGLPLSSAPCSSLRDRPPSRADTRGWYAPFFQSKK